MVVVKIMMAMIFGVTTMTMLVTMTDPPMLMPTMVATMTTMMVKMVRLSPTWQQSP